MPLPPLSAFLLDCFVLLSQFLAMTVALCRWFQVDRNPYHQIRCGRCGYFFSVLPLMFSVLLLPVPLIDSRIEVSAWMFWNL